MNIKPNNISVTKASLILPVFICILISIFPSKFGIKSDGEYLQFSFTKLSRATLLFYSIYFLATIFLLSKELVDKFRCYIIKLKMSVKHSKKNKVICSAFLIFITFYIYFLFKANLDLLNPDSVYMDELIVFDRIKEIYKNPIKLIINNDYRYGIFLWNIPAIISYIPYQVFGDKAIIFLTRILTASILFFSYTLLVRDFLTKPAIQILVLTLFLTLPYSAYFSTLPKIEPIQLFFIALSLRNLKRKGINSKLFWLFSGLALGAKITYLPFMFFIAFFYSLLYKSFKNIFFCIVGYIISFPQIFLIGNPLNLIKITKSNAWLDNQAELGLLEKTSRWLSYFGDQYFWEIDNIGYIILILIAFGIYKSLSRNKLNIKVIFIPEILLIIIAFSMIIPIILSVTRLWGLYLHIGLVLLMLPVFSLIEKNSNNKLLKLLSLSTCLIFTFNVIYYKSKDNYPYDQLMGYKQISQRTQSNTFKELSNIKSHLVLYFNKTNEQSKVLISPILFRMKNTEKMSFVNYYGSYLSETPKTDLDDYKFIIITAKEFKNIQIIHNKLKHYYYEIETEKAIKEQIKIFKRKNNS